MWFWKNSIDVFLVDRNIESREVFLHIFSLTDDLWLYFILSQILEKCP